MSRQTKPAREIMASALRTLRIELQTDFAIHTECSKGHVSPQLGIAHQAKMELIREALAADASERRGA